jgi:hypothetical protein
MTSMSVDFKAIREVGNRLYPISMTTPWVTIEVREISPGEWITKGKVKFTNTLFGCIELGQELGILEFSPEFQRLERHENWARNSAPIP